MKYVFFIIKGYLLWILYYLYSPYRNKIKEEAKRRIKICESCSEYNIHIGTCALCGCFMKIKTKMPLLLDKEGISLSGCWLRKW